MKSRPLALTALLALGSCIPDLELPDRESRPASASTPQLVELRLDDMPDEHRRSGLRQRPTVDDVVTLLDEVVADDEAKGLFLRIGVLGRGAARGEEIAAALGRVRAAHKPVHCHFEVTDNLGYMLMARGCDRLTMTPAGHLASMGVAAHLQSVRGLLEWAGVQMEMVQTGRAKGAEDPFVRDEPSPAHRENVEQLVGELNTRLLRGIAARTRKSEAEALELVGRAPFTSTQARAAGLVDDAEFDDEAREHARRAANATRVVDRTPGRREGPKNVSDLLDRLTEDDPHEPPGRAHVVFASLTGTIVDGTRSPAESVASEPFVTAMRGFTHDDDVRAVVLRIDSPGGSALASDRMWHAVHRLAERKPVVVSVGDMAASGGYYVACAGREIFANEASVVGSIGVVAGRPNLSVLMERFGVRVHTIAGAPSADLFAPFRPLRPEERERFVVSSREAYDRFLARITTRRQGVRLPDAAEGRVFTGRSALGLGLVDRLGSARDALARARELARLGTDAPVVRWPRTPGLIEALLGDGGESALSSVGVPEELAVLLRSLETESDTPLAPRAALPYSLVIR